VALHSAQAIIAPRDVPWTSFAQRILAPSSTLPLRSGKLVTRSDDGYFPLANRQDKMESGSGSTEAAPIMATVVSAIFTLRSVLTMG